MKIVLLYACLMVANLFGSFSLDNQFGSLGSSSIKTEAVKQNYLSEPLESLIDADKYILGPGDGIYLNIVTANQIVNLNLFISPIGDILIPVVGTVKVDGLTINQGFKVVQKKCLEKYNDSNVSITLSKVREIKIKVLGPFRESGIYVSNPINRVSDIYSQIITKNIESSLADTSITSLEEILSRRNIILERNSRESRVDLMKFNITGNDSHNPFLKTGDVIYFDLIDNQITITGGVKSPGVYEFAEDETVQSAIELAGGLRYNADRDKIEIVRYGNDSVAKTIGVKQSEFPTTDLLPQDLLSIKIKQDYKVHKLVEIKGQVPNPGLYTITEGVTTVKDIIQKAGGYTALADKNKISIFNIDNSSLELEASESENALYRQEFHDYIHKSYKINEHSQLVPMNSSSKYQTEKMLAYNVYDGDTIEIPKDYPYIEVVGAVKYPGLYSYKENKSIQQYLQDAGGITSSETGDIFIIKPYSGQRINYKDINKIESGDVIYIVEKIKLDKRTKLENSIMIANGITSTLSFILSLVVLLGGAS